MIIVEGTVENIIYRNNKNSYTICRVLTEDGTITMVGYIPFQTPGSQIRVRGEMVYHDKYGEQFSIKKYLDTETSYSNNMEAYLKSGAVDHIGPTLADRILKKFGEETYHIFKNEPERLKEVNGIGEKTYEKIMKSFSSQADLNDIMIELANYGINPSLATELFQRYGENVVDIIKENPYRLMNEENIGFKTADSIAMEMGFKKDDPKRMAAGTVYILGQSTKEGHTYLPGHELEERLKDLLQIPMISIDEILNNSSYGSSSYFMNSSQGTRAYTMNLNSAEKYIGLKLKQLKENQIKLHKIDLDARIRLIEHEEAISFADKQKQAIKSAFYNKVLIISGGPGTGKTTILKAILRIAEEMGISYRLAAPTGRAAQRMSEATGSDASTIHRLLEYSYNGYYMKFERDEYNPLDEELIIIDEMSMVDTYLFADLLKALREDARLILIGDIDQLPSVGPGNVLKDLMASDKLAVVKLDEIFRQDKNSYIVENAHRINIGKRPIINAKNSDFFFIESKDQEESLDIIKSLVSKRLPKFYKLNGLEDIQVLAPMKKGLVGINNLNKELQETLNPKDPFKEQIRSHGRIFRLGDKVMQNRNNYELEWNIYDENHIAYDSGLGVYNGDIGYIRSISREKESLEIDFSGRYVEYQEKDLNDLDLAYAITIHKSQGSEFPVIVIPIHYTPKILGNRNLIYTAITRASKLVVLVGKNSRFIDMINNTYTSERYTSLTERIWEMDRILE